MDPAVVWLKTYLTGLGGFGLFSLYYCYYYLFGGGGLVKQDQDTAASYTPKGQGSECDRLIGAESGRDAGAREHNLLPETLLVLADSH